MKLFVLSLEEDVLDWFIEKLANSYDPLHAFIIAFMEKSWTESIMWRIPRNLIMKLFMNMMTLEIMLFYLTVLLLWKRKWKVERIGFGVCTLMVPIQSLVRVLELSYLPSWSYIQGCL